MRLTLVISSMGPGGAERVMSILANHWARRGWEITLLTFDDGSRPPFYRLDPAIRYSPMAIAGESPDKIAGALNNLARILKLRRHISASRPDAVVSFMSATNALTVLATRGLGVKVAVSEHSDPVLDSPGFIWDTARKLAYRMADKIVFLSDRSVAFFPPAVRKKSVVIPNPISEPAGEEDPGGELFPKPAVIAMGRFGPEKGFDLLLAAFAGLMAEFPEWSLVIIGDGPLRPELEALAEKLGLGGRVFMPGRVQNPYSYLRQADLFVLSSRNEGFPMALCEAMACGLAVASFDCRTGPREIIRDGVDGVLVPDGDAEALKQAMRRLMADGGERKRLGARAAEVVERFSLERVAGMWDKLFDAVQSGR